MGTDNDAAGVMIILSLSVPGKRVPGIPTTSSKGDHATRWMDCPPTNHLTSDGTISLVNSPLFSHPPFSLIFKEYPRSARTYRTLQAYQIFLQFL